MKVGIGPLFLADGRDWSVAGIDLGGLWQGQQVGLDACQQLLLGSSGQVPSPDAPGKENISVNDPAGLSGVEDDAAG